MKDNILPILEKTTKMTGYWSGKTVQFNETDKVLCDDTMTTADVIQVLTDFQRHCLPGWLAHDKSFRFNGRLAWGDLRWEFLPEFANDVYKRGGYICLAPTFKNLVERYGSQANAEQAIRQAWQTSAWGEGAAKAIRFGGGTTLLGAHATLLLPTNTLADYDRDNLLADLMLIHNTDNTKFIPEGEKVRHIQENKALFMTTRDALMSSAAGAAFRRLAPDVAQYLSINNAARHWDWWPRFQTACSQWLLLGALGGRWLMPLNASTVTPDLTSLRKELGRQFEWDVLDNDERMWTSRWLSKVYASSTLRDIDDTPELIMDIVPYPKIGNHESVKTVASVLKAHRNTPPFPTHLLEHQHRNALTAFKKYTPGWARSNLSADWASFFTLWDRAQPNLSVGRRRMIASLIEWALPLELGPWDITPIHLNNVHAPGDTTTFHQYLKQRQNATGNPESQIAATLWSFTAKVFKDVCNLAKLPSIEPDLTVPEEPVDPFQDLPQILKRSNHNRKTRKTPRSRLLTELQEALVDELLGLQSEQREVYQPQKDEHGNILLDDDGQPLLADQPTTITVQVPTFDWARQQAEAITDAYKSRAPDWYQFDDEWHWNPSTAVALALLLLMPLRGKQVRWLDQGLMDSEVFDFSTGRMIPNEHSLAAFRYADGSDQEAYYGSASGTIQLHPDEMDGALEPVIWASTNKTALWDGCKKTGYALPWPDGQLLMLSDDSDLQKRGQHLARVYEVLRFQHLYMAQHDPDPSPISFYHVASDSRLVPSDDDLRQQLPWFVPLCRQLGHKEITVTWPDGTKHRTAQPVSPQQIEKLYNALCVHVERKLRKDKRLSRLALTTKVESGDTKAVERRRAKYDIHSLRVAGISRLIELGIPAHLVSEYIAGHATVIMTLRYFQTTPMYMRKQLMEAFLRGDLIDGIESITERLAEMQEVNSLLPPAERVRQHVTDLPLDFAALAPVEGGVCVMGGKGSHCDICATTIRETDTAGKLVTEYTEQLGGCAGGRFYRTGPDFLLQQALEANKLMVLLRRKARERKQTQESLLALSRQINTLNREIEGGNLPHGDLAHTRSRYDRLVIRRNTAKDRLADQDESLAPVVLQWYQRWKDFTDSQALSEELGAQQGTGQMVVIGDSEQIDFSSVVASGNDFGLARTVMEQMLCYVRTGQELPEDCRHLVKDFLNRILAAEAPELMLPFNQPHTAAEETMKVATLASIVSATFGDEQAQACAEGLTHLGFDDNLKQGIRNVCEQPALALPDDQGRFNNLQQIRINVIDHDSSISD
ncbi:hypothetical protein BIZ37_00400 [Photobacterium sp. BZF1]|uniref:VPA1269 family protein n=1 Tax=Photobacterium sp. BZF1 TaxID=1904457 RepID=UPI001653D912|nr:VPA1269 family protein [Photobacterium sp. BZF1]MBC7000998.1 hypothetical protein [Photobacterium sp. BZF1]